MEREEGPKIALGCFLGNWTDEIEKDYGEGAEIIEFVSTGAKSYGFSVRKSNGEVLFYISIGYSKREPPLFSYSCRVVVYSNLWICERPPKIVSTVKSKGFTLDSDTSEIIHMERMKKMVAEYSISGIIEKLELQSEAIRRTADHEVVTCQVSKRFGVTADKRRLGRNFFTYAYGSDM